MARVLFVLLLAGCAAGQPASSDRISGVVLLAQSEQVLGGVRVVLVPQGEPIDEVPPGDYASEAVTTEAGAFAFDALEGIAVGPLVRGWRYELRAEAAGFQTGRIEFEFEGGPLALTVPMVLEGDDTMQGQQIRELSDDSIQNPSGTLIDEVLRKQGRLPRGRK